MAHFLSYARKIRKGLRRLTWHCAKVKGHAELKIEKSRVQDVLSSLPHLAGGSRI